MIRVAEELEKYGVVVVAERVGDRLSWSWTMDSDTQVMFTYYTTMIC